MDPGEWAAQPKATMPIERSTSFLKVPGAEGYPVGPLLAFLVTIMLTVGADDSIFPNITKALENTVGFDVGELATLQTIQGVTQAVLGPIWGVLCARGYLDRRTVLAILTFSQGLATLIMAFSMNQFWTMRLLRGINGACLSGMMPVTFSIIADRFDDEVRGRMCALMNMCKGVGGATFGFLYGWTGEWCTSEGRWQSCASEDCTGATDCGCGAWFGWQYAFVMTGGVTIAFAPFVFAFMRPPPIIVKSAPTSGENILLKELKALGKILYNTPTFAVLVLQGCFGAMPWNAMFLRSFFFQTFGLSAEQATTILTAANYVGIFGTGLSGWLSDTLVKIWPMHGRIINAELSVYSGVPICFLTFSSTFAPSGANAFAYFMTLSVLLAVVQGGVQGGTNIPILSQLAEPEDRALIISWQSALEGAVATFGPVIFATLNSIFGYRGECEGCNPPIDCDADLNKQAAGNALLYTTMIPWTICGVLYSTLHCLYPRDMERIFEQRRLAAEAAGADLNTELTNS